MNDFCLFACSDEFQLSRGLEFIRIVQDLCQQLGLVLNKMDYTFADDELDNAQNEAVINSENLNHLDLILRKEMIDELLLWSDRIPSGESEYINLDAELRSKKFDNYKYVCIYFRMEFVENWAMAKLFSLASDSLNVLNHLGRLDYALITTMKAFLPQTYFRGIFTSGLSKEAALNLAMWKQTYVDRKKKLRGLYWGNLLSSSHLAQIGNKGEFLDILETSGCLYTPINGDDLFFMFPSSSSLIPSRDLIEAFLKKNDLLMEPDDKAREDVNRYLVLGS